MRVPKFQMLGGVALLYAGLAGAQQPKPADRLERGRYLVEEVAKCQLCHTPKNEAGELDRSKWMKGAVLDFQPIQPVPGWHKTSPDITPSGRLWKNWTEAGLLKYMQTGLTPKGKLADAPMPAYKLTREDAEAVVEYLKAQQ